MRNYDGENFVMMPVPASMFAAVCAVIGGASNTALTVSGDKHMAPSTDVGIVGNAAASPIAETAETTNSTGTDASPSDNGGKVDAHGWPWSPDMHASTKGMTKEGLWRMKVGVTRPDPKPGFPVSDGATSTTSNGADSPAPATATTGDAGPATSPVEDEDEFAAFRAAADKSAGTDAAAAASVPARKWTDADLGALCNQAAVKLGDPAPVKAIIEQFVPADAVPHSRNIPDDRREEFAQAVEAKADIKFAG